MPVDAVSNRNILLDVVNRAHNTSNEPVYMDVNRRYLLAGAEAIERDWATTINLAISDPVTDGEPFGHTGDARRLASQFTVPGVLAAGILDSINPCAVAALIFLVSVLTLARERPINVLVAGLAYCFGVFATYTAIGFGLLQAIRALNNFHAIRFAFDIFLCALLAVLAILAFRDAAIARAGIPAKMALRLPDPLSALVRATLRNRFGAAVALSSAFLAGCLVTAIETVCTGQIYGPTLAIIVAQGGSVWHESALLLLYNLMFVLPLLVILFLTWRGIAVSRLLAWSATNAVVAKIAMGFLFLGLLAALVYIHFRG
jgi:thiol:disulfide interchange protein